MRKGVLFFICLCLIQLSAQCQAIKEQLCAHAWQQSRSSAIWSFKENGDFSAILFWGSKKNGGFIAKKGTYSVIDSAKILKLAFDSSYNVYSKDSFSVRKDAGLQEWHLISVAASKIVVSRPPVWPFEKTGMFNGDKNLLITLYGKKKRKSN